MVRRQTLRSVAALVAALAVLSAAPSRADDNAKAAHEHHEAFVKCAKVCYDCALECTTCYRHCAHLVADGKKGHAVAMHLCNDCATICAAAGELSGRIGPLAATLCEACAKACDKCGEACEKQPDDDHMKRCARACRECAKA